MCMQYENQILTRTLKNTEKYTRNERNRLIFAIFFEYLHLEIFYKLSISIGMKNIFLLTMIKIWKRLELK